MSERRARTPGCTHRGTREECPAAPGKFNILHHVATRQLRTAWKDDGIGGTVEIETLARTLAYGQKCFGVKNIFSHIIIYNYNNYI